MATVTSWAGTITDIGPMYPFVGTEGILTVILLVVWIVWHIMQLRDETREHEKDRAEIVKNKDMVKRMLERDGG